MFWRNFIVSSNGNKNSDISNANITNLINKDSNKISWSDGLINNLVKGKEINYESLTFV